MYTEDFLIDSNWVDPFLDLSLPSLFRILQTVATNGAEAIGAGKAETTDKGYFWVRTRMWVEISRLPRRCRRILLMGKVQGKKYSEIAREMGISENTVRNQMAKALKTVREGVKKAVLFLFSL